VLHDLFACGERLGAYTPVPVDDIARRTGLDLPSIRGIATSLGRRRLSRRRSDTLLLVDPMRTLTTWIALWDGQRQTTRSYHVGLEWTTLVPTLVDLWKEVAWAWTGVAGAALARDLGTPLHRVCYIAGRDLQRACEGLERALPVVPVAPGDGGTVHIAIPRCARSQLFYGRQITRFGAPVVSTTQQLLDLLRGPASVEHSPVADAARRVTWELLVREAPAT
jgi:hypothetical protein